MTSVQTMDKNATTPGYGDLTGIVNRVNGVDVLSLQYQHDALGRIRRIDEVIQGSASTRQFEYDSAGRLIRVRDGADTILSEYEYDKNGARTRVQTATQLVELGVNLGCGQDMTQPVDAQDVGNRR